MSVKRSTGRCKLTNFYRAKPVLCVMLRLRTNRNSIAPVFERDHSTVRSKAFVGERQLGKMIVILLFVLAGATTGQAQTETFAVDGSERQAIVYANSKHTPGKSAPVVFVFHGHGGTAVNVARRFRIQELWPEAVVVYMQGIPGIVGITDKEGKQNGWQKSPGEAGDRDIKFFDAALARMQQKYKTDPNRVYVLGHSNGGRFVNVLWNTRGDRLAALCSGAGPGGRLVEDALPKPVYIIAGENDQLVPFQGQRVSIELTRKRLKTDPSKAKVNGLERTEPGVNGTELVTYIHPGGHQFPVEALAGVVKFFERHIRK